MTSLHNGYRVFPGGKAAGPWLDHPPHLAQKLKKDLSYTSAPPMGLRGLLWGEFNFTFYVHDHMQ